MTAHAGFTLPDLTTSLPRGPFEYGGVAVREVATRRTAPPGEIFRRLLRDQESEVTFLLARHVLDAFLPLGDTDAGAGSSLGQNVDASTNADAMAAMIGQV